MVWLCFRYADILIQPLSRAVGIVRSRSDFCLDLGLIDRYLELMSPLREQVM